MVAGAASMTPVPLLMDPSRAADWERAFEAMSLDELAELRRILVVVLVRRRSHEREARR
jgi:hypothetical protein